MPDLVDAPTISSTDPASPAAENNPKVKGSVGAGNPTQVEIYTNASCSGSPASTGSVAQFTGSGITVALPADTTTALSARAKNVDNDTSDCSNSVNYTEDSTPPETTIDSGPSGATNDATPTFTFHSSEAGSSFECSIDTGSPNFGPCSGPGGTHTPSGPLSEGPHTFRVRATDPASNTDPSPDARAFTVQGAPVFGKRANASTVSGVVKVKVPGSRKFVHLTAELQIPIGSIVDARNGRVRIVSADGKPGKTRMVEFWGGLFKLRQDKATRGYTDGKLVGRLACGEGRAAATPSKERRRGRYLWGSSQGKSSSTGKNSSASAQGAKWLVWDRCDGSTLTFATSASVLVRDFHSGRKVLVRKGQHYVAKSKRKHSGRRG